MVDLYMFHNARDRNQNCLYVINTCCVLTRKNGNLVWFCIYFKTKRSAVITVHYLRLASSCAISRTNLISVLRSVSLFMIIDEVMI
jgi:hypothetical protein